MKLPCRVTVKSIVTSRYGNSLKEGESRPMSWDDRKEGVDVVLTDCGGRLTLNSDGGQSVPQPGWVILITDGDEVTGYRWTLFGMPKGVEVHTQ